MSHSWGLLSKPTANAATRLLRFQVAQGLITAKYSNFPTFAEIATKL